jgi:hypothetical protein
MPDASDMRLEGGEAMVGIFDDVVFDGTTSGRPSGGARRKHSAWFFTSGEL